MKKFIVPIVAILGLFLVVFVVLASTDRTTTAALFGAGYSAFLMAIYALIPAIKNPSYSMWWSLPDDVTPAERWGFYIGNFLVCGAVYSSSFQISKDSFSEISIVYFVVVPVVVAIIAYFVRRIIVKRNK